LAVLSRLHHLTEYHAIYRGAMDFFSRCTSKEAKIIFSRPDDDHQVFRAEHHPKQWTLSDQRLVIIMTR
jgi:ketosteroid isomerase-like protein